MSKELHAVRPLYDKKKKKQQGKKGQFEVLGTEINKLGWK